MSDPTTKKAKKRARTEEAVVPAAAASAEKPAKSKKRPASDAAALAEQPAKKAKAPGDAAAAATDAAAAAEAKRQKRLASRKAFREKRKRQRKERIQQLLASRPAREKRDLVAEAPADCQVWLAANPLDLALKTLRQYLPGIASIFWLPKGGGYVAFETQAALEHALALKQVDADGSVTRIDRCGKAQQARQAAESGPAPAEAASSDTTANPSSSSSGGSTTEAAGKPEATAPSEEAEAEAKAGSAKPITRKERKEAKRLKWASLKALATLDSKDFEARLKMGVDKQMYQKLMEVRREAFDVIPKDDDAVGYQVVPKGQRKDRNSRHAGKPEAFISNRPTFIATAALKKRMAGLAVVQWVQAPRDKTFRASGYEGARVAFSSPEAAAEALAYVQYNVHGSDVFVPGRPKALEGPQQ